MAFWARPSVSATGLRRPRGSSDPLAFFEEPDLAAPSTATTPRGCGYSRSPATPTSSPSAGTRRSTLGQAPSASSTCPRTMFEFFPGMISFRQPPPRAPARIGLQGLHPPGGRIAAPSIEEVADRLHRRGHRGGCDSSTCARLPAARSRSSATSWACRSRISPGLPVLEHHRLVRRPRVPPSRRRPARGACRGRAGVRRATSELLAVRRRHPADDLTEALVTTEVNGDALTEPELGHFFILLLTAGHDTTLNSSPTGSWPSSSIPTSWRCWQADPVGVRTAVDEMVRFVTPVHWTGRYLHEDLVLGGTHSDAGEIAILLRRRPTATTRSSWTRTASTSGARPTTTVGFGTPPLASAPTWPGGRST